MRVVFMGTPDFAAAALRALLAAGHDVACVYTQAPRPAGRGQREQKSAVHLLAEERGLEVRTPLNLKSPETQAAFAALKAEIAVVAAYGLILPQATLDAPRQGCLNIHASLLPRWRGAAPIHRAILAGDAQTGITIMQMEAGLDTGPGILQEAIAIAADDTARTLHDRLADLGGRLIVEALSMVGRGDVRPHPQPEEGVVYAAKLTREEGRVDWRRPAEEIERQVRAFDPWPGAWFEHRGERVKLLAAGLAPVGRNAEPGILLDEAAAVACGAGALMLKRLQRAGRGPVTGAEFMRGLSLKPGDAVGD